MKNAHWFLLAFAVAACGSDGNPADPEPEEEVIVDGWRLVWADEFDDDGAPDAAKWDYDLGGDGWGNGELQLYTRNTNNVRVENGNLVIEARREQAGANDYTSARIVTRGKAFWTYGRFEARAQLPSGRGTWPAIWMLPNDGDPGGGVYGGWPKSGEIDIMEHVGFDPDVVHATVHTEAYNHTKGTQRGKQTRVPTARSDFHVYAVEWTPEEIRGYVDDELYFTFANKRLTDPSAGPDEWPFDRPFYLLMNIAVGGSWGGAQGVDNSIFPQQMLVDYVRVYERAEE